MSDKRWENVEAYVGPPRGYVYEEPDSPVDVTKFTQFRIEVQTDKGVYYCNIIVANDELEVSRVRVYQFTLDKMVDQIDAYIDEQESVRPTEE